MTDPTPLEKEPTPFELWYAAYPKKVASKRAEKAYKAALKLATPEDLQAASEAQAVIWDDVTQYKSKKGSVKTLALKYLPNPEAWLNGGNWTNEDIREYLSKPKQPASIVIKENELAYFAWTEFDPTLKTFGGKIVVPTEWPPQGDER